MLKLPKNVEPKPEFPFRYIQIPAPEIVERTYTGRIGKHQREIVPTYMLVYPDTPGVRPIDIRLNAYSSEPDRNRH